MWTHPQGSLLRLFLKGELRKGSCMKTAALGWIRFLGVLIRRGWGRKERQLNMQPALPSKSFHFKRQESLADGVDILLFRRALPSSGRSGRGSQNAGEPSKAQRRCMSSAETNPTVIEDRKTVNLNRAARKNLLNPDMKV